MDYERTKAKLAAHPATEQGRVNRSSPGMELEFRGRLLARTRGEDTMAAATQLALTHGLKTEKRSRESRPFADAQPQNIAGRGEEAQLVFAAQNGDGHAFEILMERYQRRILAIARRFTRIREDAEDIVQQSFQKAFVHLHKFEGKSSFSTWLTRIAINEALMLLRKGRGLREISIDDISGDEETGVRLEIADSRPSPESAFLEGERKRILLAGVNKLK